MVKGILEQQNYDATVRAVLDAITRGEQTVEVTSLVGVFDAVRTNSDWDCALDNYHTGTFRVWSDVEGEGDPTNGTLITCELNHVALIEAWIDSWGDHIDRTGEGFPAWFGNEDKLTTDNLEQVAEDLTSAYRESAGYYARVIDYSTLYDAARIVVRGYLDAA